MRLADLDQRVIPEAARRTAALAAWFRRALPLHDQPPHPRAVTPAPLVLRLRAVDDRWAATGALAWLRDIPQLGALAIGLIVVTAGATVVTRQEARPPPTEVASGPPVGPATPGEGGLVGPMIGDDVLTYVDEAERRLEVRAAGEPDEEVYAVVSFGAYRSPVEAAALLIPGITAIKGFYRVPPRPREQTDLLEFAIGDGALVPEAVRAFEQRAAFRTGEVRELDQVNTTTTDPAQHAYNSATAAQYRREAAALKQRCACLYGVAVQAKLRVLQELAGRTGIRLVDAAPANTDLELLTFAALLPEEKVTVTRGNEGARPGG